MIKFLYQEMYQRRNIIAILVIMLIVGMFYFPTIKDIDSTIISEDDWFGFYYYAGISRLTALKYHQLPLRTPYLGGGYPSIAHPFDYTLSPFFFFILLFGEVAGLRLMVYFIFMFGSLGMFYFTRYVLKYNLMGAIFSCLTFSLCSWGAFEVVDGNIPKIFCYLLPWLFAFLLQSKKDKRFLILACLVLSPILTLSGLSFIPVVLALFLLACFYAVSINKGFKFKIRGSYIAFFLAIIIGTCLLFAIKVIPMFELYKMRTEYIHLPYENSYSAISRATKAFGACLDMELLKKSLLDKSFRGYSTMYLGYLPLVFMFLSILIYAKKNMRYILLLIVFALIQFGSRSPLDLFKIFWQIHPSVHGIWRLNKYFGFFIPFFISIIAGRFFLIFRHKKIIKPLVFIIIGISAYHMYSNNRLIFSPMVYERKPSLEVYDSFFPVEIENTTIERAWPGFHEVKDIRSYQPFWLLLRQNIGVVNFNWSGNLNLSQYAQPKYILPTGKQVGEIVYVRGYEQLSQDINVPIDLMTVARDNPHYQGEVFFLKKNNKVDSTYLSPNIVKADVSLRSPDRLIINQNYHKSWTVDKGKLINHKGLLAVELVDQGVHQVTFRYVPLDFYLGAIVSFFTLIGMLAYFWFVPGKKISFNKAK